MARVCDLLVIGAGAWGTALAQVLARAGCRALLWDSAPTLISTLAVTRHHPHFAPEVALAPGVVPIDDLTAAADAEVAVLVVPFQVLRSAFTALAAALPGLPAIACASKGFELDSGCMAHEVAAAIFGSERPFAQFSGPNFAIEVMRGRPAAITIGASTEALGRGLVGALHGPGFRPYYTDDVIGVEIGGALKNVIAIAAGIADGLALGSNTRAALITRGLAEIARFGVARGGRLETFMGLSGMGDLVLTCTDDQSRNRRFGLALARLGSVAQAQAEVGALVEGVPTAQAVAAMAAARGIDMPIAREVVAVLSGASTPEAAVTRLLARDPTAESLRAT